MNRLRKCLILVLCMSMVCSLMTVTAMAGDNDEIRRIGYETLNDKQKVVYDQLLKGIAAGKKSIKLQSNPSITDAILAFRMVYSDYPEYFWLVHDYNYYYSGNKMTDFMPNYLDIRDQTEAVEQACEEILSGMPDSADTDYEKALYLHDALAAWTDYEGNAYDQSAYSALVLRSTVCAGYAHAYQLLLNKVGITAWVVDGTAGDGGNHSWNQVWLDDQCVYTDVTWDDVGDYAIYDNFNQSLEPFSVEHYPEDIFEAGIPPCDHDLALIAPEENVHIVDNTVTGEELAAMATILQEGDFTYASVRLRRQDESIDFHELYDQVKSEFMDATGCKRIRITYLSFDECILTASRGLGGTYEELTDNLYRFWLSYHTAKLPSQEYGFWVAYYAEDGQMLKLDIIHTYLDNGDCYFVSNCEKAFAECRVFLRDPETGAPLTEALHLIAK